MYHIPSDVFEKTFLFTSRPQLLYRTGKRLPPGDEGAQPAQEGDPFAATHQGRAAQPSVLDKDAAMTIPQLREALEGISFSFIYFDSCFMGNIESLYELRNNASAIVASPTEVLTEGMPYDKT